MSTSEQTTTLNNFNNEERSLNVSPIDFDDDDTLVDSSRFSNASDMSNISNISNISNASEMSTISYPDMENYTFDGEGQHGGKKQRKTRKYKLNKRITLKHRGKKHRTTKRRRNARIKTKKQKGGTCYGNGIGANSYDPNLSIYNTRELNLFPYKPT